MSNDIGSHRILYADTRKWLMMSLIGAGFVLVGLFMLYSKGDFLAWFVTLFFGGVAAVGIHQLYAPGSLTLAADNFTVKTLGREWTEAWEQCADFAVYRTGQNRLVSYNRTQDVETHLAEMNRMLSGGSASLPDTFGMAAQELANLMNAYQAAALDRAWRQHAKFVANLRDEIAAELNASNTTANIITDAAVMELPADMQPWPSLLVVANKPRADGGRHVLLCADIGSPTSHWTLAETKQKQAFELLGADELRIIATATGEVRSFRRDAA